MGGTDVLSPHGIPVDLLDRMLIIRTMPYSGEEMTKILSIRSSTEEIEIDDSALNKLGGIGSCTSLRYAMQSLTPSRVIAETRGRTKINDEDIDEIDTLFFDGKTSARLLTKSDGYMK